MRVLSPARPASPSLALPLAHSVAESGSGGRDLSPQPGGAPLLCCSDSHAPTSLTRRPLARDGRTEEATTVRFARFEVGRCACTVSHSPAAAQGTANHAGQAKNPAQEHAAAFKSLGARQTATWTQSIPLADQRISARKSDSSAWRSLDPAARIASLVVSFVFRMAPTKRSVCLLRQADGVSVPMPSSAC